MVRPDPMPQQRRRGQERAVADGIDGEQEAD